jgi:hypothetical protein
MHFNLHIKCKNKTKINCIFSSSPSACQYTWVRLVHTLGAPVHACLRASAPSHPSPQTANRHGPHTSTRQGYLASLHISESAS